MALRQLAQTGARRFLLFVDCVDPNRGIGRRHDEGQNVQDDHHSVVPVSDLSRDFQRLCCDVVEINWAENPSIGNAISSSSVAHEP